MNLINAILLVVGLLALAVVMAPAMAQVGHSVRDRAIKATRALPASTSAVVSTVIDTGTPASGRQLADWELLLTAPAVTTAQLPDAKTFTYDILHSDNADLSSPSVLFENVIVQTGADAAGAAAATKRFKLPTDTKRYVGFNVTPSASGTGDASGATATLEGLF